MAVEVIYIVLNSFHSYIYHDYKWTQTQQLSFPSLRCFAMIDYPTIKTTAKLKLNQWWIVNFAYRYAFLFDKALLVCKKRSGENMELKDLIDLQHFQLRDEPTGDKENKKVLLHAVFFSLLTLFCVYLCQLCLVFFSHCSGHIPSCWWIRMVKVVMICTSRHVSWRRNG